MTKIILNIKRVENISLSEVQDIVQDVRDEKPKASTLQRELKLKPVVWDELPLDPERRKGVFLIGEIDSKIVKGLQVIYLLDKVFSIYNNENDQLNFSTYQGAQMKAEDLFLEEIKRVLA